MILNPLKIRSEIETYFESLTESEKVIQGVQGFGHQAGMPIEDWMKNKLNDCFGDIHTYDPKDFSHLVLNEKRIDVERILEGAWWGCSGYRGDRFLITKKQITSIKNGAEISQWQQSGSDLVVYYGEEARNINNIITINVKSHNTERKSRDPNIMSAQRLLYFLKNVLEKDFNLDDINIWFLGVSYHSEDENAIIEEVCVKDLFLLDLEKLPLINFDAAIQIQWHVHNMIEKEQTRLKFIQNLAETFLEQWTNHHTGKTERYKVLVGDIQEAIRFKNHL